MSSSGSAIATRGGELFAETSPRRGCVYSTAFRDNFHMIGEGGGGEATFNRVNET